jgi:hypothetical protein
MALWQAAVDFVSTLFQVVTAGFAFRKLHPEQQPPTVLIQFLTVALLIVVLGMTMYASVSLITLLLAKLGHV